MQRSSIGARDRGEPGLPGLGPQRPWPSRPGRGRAGRVLALALVVALLLAGYGLWVALSRALEEPVLADTDGRAGGSAGPVAAGSVAGGGAEASSPPGEAPVVRRLAGGGVEGSGFSGRVPPASGEGARQERVDGELSVAPGRQPAGPPRDAGVPGDRQRRARFGAARWGLPGLCPGEDTIALLTRRQALYASFVVASIGDASIRHAPEVPGATLRHIAEALQTARTRASDLVDWPPAAEPPPVIVYRDDDQLRGVACINQVAIGYYDGSIHLSIEPRHVARHLRETIVHEYLHHVLNTLGVRLPTWFHEGLAMHAAQETWFADPRLRLSSWLKQSRIPFEAMVPAFPHAADEPFAIAAYYQSFVMVQFLIQRRGPAILRALAHDLGARTVTPTAAFAHAAALSAPDLESAWQQFVAAPGGLR
jgi:hypothetical protein